VRSGVKYRKNKLNLNVRANDQLCSRPEALEKYETGWKKIHLAMFTVSLSILIGLG